LIDRKIIIEMLENYNRHKIVLEELEREGIIGISAQVLSETPRSVTNKFHSITETLALWSPEKDELMRSIAIVDTWLNNIPYLYKFILTQIYIQRNSYYIISSIWKKEHDVIQSDRFWKYKRKEAISYIADAYKKSSD
jgi:ArpU family phage transcriptional regulator